MKEQRAILNICVIVCA